MSAWKTVFWKEVRENIRDRRTMLSTFVYGTLMGPVLFDTIAAGGVHGETPLVFALRDAAEAHRALESRTTTGPIVLAAQEC